MPAEDPLQCWVDLSEELADTVARGRDLTHDVIVEAAEHGEFRDLLVSELDRPERVRERSCCLGDDRRVAGIGLRFTGVQVRDSAHHQAGKIAHEGVSAWATAIGSAPIVAG